MKMKKFWLGLMAAALAVGCDSRKATADEASAAPEAAPAVAEAAADGAAVLATVNGVDITADKVDRVVKMFTDRVAGSIGEDELAAIMPRVRERALDDLIEQQILVSAADAAGVELSDAEFDEVMGELKEELPEGMTLESFLETTGLKMDEIRGQMRIRKMMLEKAESAGEPTEEEVRAFYDDHQSAMEEKATVTASHILVQVGKDDDEAAKAEKRAKIEGLKKQLDEGADFAELARENSDCPSRADGGNLGKFGRGMMVPEFEEAAFTQEIGKVGDVVETSFGYHLVLVKERTEDTLHSFDEMKERIAEMMKAQRQQEAVQAFLMGLEEAAEVTRYDDAVDGGDDEEPLDLVFEEEDIEIEAEAAPEAAEGEAEEKAAEAAEEVSEEVSEAADAAAEVAADVAEEAAETSEEAAVAAEEALEEASNAVEEAADAAVEAAEEAAADVAEAAADAVEAAAEAAEDAAESAE